MYFRGLAGTVAKEGLNIAQICSILQAMGCEPVPQGMHGGWFGDARLVLGRMEHSLYAGL